MCLDDLKVVTLLTQVPEPHGSITAAESHQVRLVGMTVQAVQAHMISRAVQEVVGVGCVGWREGMGGRACALGFGQ